MWRIHENATTGVPDFVQHKVFKEEYALNQTQSQYSNLDWSSDGQVLATTSGSVGGMFTAPLILRGSFSIAGHLKGHERSVSVAVSYLTTALQP